MTTKMESPVKRSKESKKAKLMSDLNNMEHVNNQLKGKLKLLTSEMKDAIEKMNTMTSEISTVRNENLLLKDRMAELEQENALLVSQIEEMANERAERDAIIEEFGSAVEARIVEWKAILDEKDSMITKLKENLMYAASDRAANVSPEERSHAEIERLIQDIDRRDEIIAELQCKLSEAVIEINESTLMIEKFKSDSKGKDPSKRNARYQREADRKLQEATKRISRLETFLASAESDAKLKSAELCEALAILNKYEDENSSLTLALREIKDLKEQLKKKSQYVEELINLVNKLEKENSRYEEAVVILRDKLGDEEDDKLLLGDLVLKRQKMQEEKVEQMQRDNNTLESENVDLKFQIRKLKTIMKESLKNNLGSRNGIASDGETIEDLSYGSESKKDHVELVKIKENVKWVIEENEALRQGMHEILDCIHNQDGKSIVSIQSQTLENLLDALDARHIAGWYHPAMRLQGRLSYLQGSNAELRAQLQQIRKNQSQTDVQLRASSVEEGECSQAMITPDSKMQSPLTHSRNATPKSARSGYSQNADSGMASGKAVDDIQNLEDDDVKSRDDDTSPVVEEKSFGKKSEEVYAMAKEMIAQESDFKKALSDAEKQQRILESQIISLRKNLANFVSPEVYNELREKYLESNMRLRAAYENKLSLGEDARVQELQDEVVVLHKKLSELTHHLCSAKKTDPKIVEKLESRVSELEAENERLKKAAEIAQEEALVHRAIDSTVLSEFNELKQRILKFESKEEARETARLSLELANYKVIETELRERKKLQELELTRMRDELAEIRSREVGDKFSGPEKTRDNVDCSEFIEIIDFLQHQYAGSTSLSAWERYEASLNKLNNDRNEVKELIMKINDQNENIKIQYETLTGRLKIVEQLKDMLEQQIGSSDVLDIMQRFSNETKKTLAESKYKLQISQLEEAVLKANNNIIDYEAKIILMEREINKAQKAWKVQKEASFKRPAIYDKVTETEVFIEVPKQTRDKSTETKLEVDSVHTQCTFCSKSSTPTKSKTDSVLRDTEDESDTSSRDDVESAVNAKKIILLQEQLGQALTLASERSVALSKCESQLIEYRSKNAALLKLLEEKNPNTLAVVLSKVDKSENTDSGPSQEAFNATISALRQIIEEKEKTINRFQALLKEDRDKHSEAAKRLQDEIKSLKNQIPGLRSPYNDNAIVVIPETPERDLPVIQVTTSSGRVEEVSSLREKISRLEMDMNLSSEHAERRLRLAEDRLNYSNNTRERLEKQHAEELESYRVELKNRQLEVNELRRQLAENRRAPTTQTEVFSFVKSLRIKDNRLADEIESELQEQAASAAATITSRQLSTTYLVDDSRVHEFEQYHSQLDNLRRQLQASMERERSYKNEIAGLQQKMSRRYMAERTQEKKASRREMQLERKVKELEDELHNTREMLDQQHMVQQAKRAKTAEDLGLWEKLKKWQKTAENLKEKLKEKTDEFTKLQSNHEKLRNLIACMEREKWFLRGKCVRNVESISQPSISPAWGPTPESQLTLPSNDALLIEDLQRECHELREKIRELVERLTSQENNLEERKRAGSAASEEDDFNEVKKLREMYDTLEKQNIRLETSNFELRLELEKLNVNMPRYREKIQYLEKYIELLKSDKSTETVYSAPAGPPRREGTTQHSRSELERTIVSMKKIIEKLQADNKRLKKYEERSRSDLGSSQCNCSYLRDELEVARQRIISLESEVEHAQKKIALMQDLYIEKSSDEDVCAEVLMLKQQLIKKNELLDRVKELLTKAASNEKALRQRIQQLEFKQTLSMIPECVSPLSGMHG